MNELIMNSILDIKICAYVVGFSLITVAYGKKISDHNHGVVDITKLCRDDQTYGFFLTYGMGSSDSVVLLASPKESKPASCLIRFLTEEGYYLFIVAEFPNNTADRRPCYRGNNTSIMVHDTGLFRLKGRDVCAEISLRQELENSNIFLHICRVGHSWMVINLTFPEVLKVTVTAARDYSQYCADDGELMCESRNLKTCMALETKCNGHLNCGVPDKYDEDPQLCKGEDTHMSWFKTLAILFTLCLLLFLAVRRYKVYVPTITGIFYQHTEPESESLTNSSTQISTPNLAAAFVNQPTAIAMHLLSSLSLAARSEQSPVIAPKEDQVESSSTGL